VHAGRAWCLGAACLLAGAGALAAQEPANPDSVLAAEKPVMLTPFVAPGYTPEQGALLTAGALISFRTSPAFLHGAVGQLVQRSTITLNASYSTTGAVTVNADLASYWNGDRRRLFFKFALKDMPDHYWGVGYEAGKAPDTDSTTAYQRTSWVVSPKILWKVKPNLFVGGLIDLNRTAAADVSPGVAADPYYQEFGPANFNAGLGLVVLHDSRDVAANAWRGLYLSSQFSVYGPPGENDYQVYDLEYRQYRQLGRPGRTLAWTARGRLTNGEVPWAELSMVGSSTDLRGYRQGRYRDKAMLYAIGEYRHQFESAGRPTGLSRHGLVGWVGAGSVGGSFADLDKWLPNWGVGYRFEVQPRMSVRADVGFGREYLDSGNKYVPSVYFGFTEAF
jgi:hypothetical protein